MNKIGGCCCPCEIYTDEFSGTSSNLGSPWCEGPSSWSKASGYAVSDTAGVIAMLDIPHPDPAGSMNVRITTANEVDNSGDKYRCILNAVRPVSPSLCYNLQDYYWAEFERLQANTSVIRLGVTIAGVSTTLKSDTTVGLTNLERGFTARISSKEFCAGVSNAVLSFVGMESPGLFANGYYSGMYVSKAAMNIDKFEFLKHWETDHRCPNCLCFCNGDGIFPPRLKVTIYPDPSTCLRLDLLDPCVFYIDYDRVNNRWINSTVSNCCVSGSSGQGWQVSVACPPSTDNFDPMNTAMNLLVGCTSSCGGCSGPNYPVSASCDPIDLLYGPYFVSASDLTCFCSSSGDIFTRGSCSYYVRIEEV
jgi:hypothetical protein